MTKRTNHGGRWQWLATTPLQHHQYPYHGKLDYFCFTSWTPASSKLRAAEMFLSLGQLFAFCIPVLQVSAAGIVQRASPQHGFEKRSPAPPDGLIKLHIALRQHDRGAEVEKRLLYSSDPRSPGFRQHLSAREVAELSKPSDECVQVVEAWLEEHGLLKHAVLGSGGIFEVDAKVEEVERLLNATYSTWTDGTQQVLRTEEISLPERLAGHIDFITPTIMFPRAKAREKASRTIPLSEGQKIARRATSSCGPEDDTTPRCIQKLYNITHTPAPNRTTFAVYATEAAVFSNIDLQNYLHAYRPEAAGATYTVIGSGDPASGPGGIESKFETALDTQVLLGLAWPARGILYNLGGVFGPDVGKEYDPFVKFLQELVANETVPSVVSFSESQPENRVERDYALRVCNLMAQVGMRGVTLLFSSGNNGPNGDTPSGPHAKIFEPEFPASCLWITAVGGTTNLSHEQAATQSTIPFLSSLGYTASGGGFSNLFPAPAWQYPSVQEYITRHVPQEYQDPSLGFPALGAVNRGIPDVSALSTQWPTYSNAAPVAIPIGGTSSATPTWAALVVILNDYQLSRNRSTLGFLNPWLYSLDAGLKDIVLGGNNVGKCDVLRGCTLTEALLGYNVTRGWDPVTGLGSPNLGLLMAELDRRGC
ncbi:Tripeptidyl-peptidase sed2 [Lecanosticta acicola]|uniref:Tripeptidyl-peptidase sed2 n=1 Tax=Lecanosticta acicola TaxID=111012 RepID=A0AAI8YRI7_9PEZI|nr:Tripeptidyl-peptidase sed2 [Lecanosticta acicola]